MNASIQEKDLRVRSAMEYLGPAGEAEVVLSFLRAEIESPRFQHRLLKELRQIGRSRESLIDHANLTKQEENRARSFLLALTRDPLFNRFPHDVAWWRCNVALSELEHFQYANYRRFFELSGGRRNVRSGAGRAIAEPQVLARELREMLSSIPAVVDGLNAGGSFPPLIAVRDTRHPQVVLVKGHLRATAYAIAGQPARIEVYIGTSDRMHEWWLF
jgi:hypothetical protein